MGVWGPGLLQDDLAEEARMLFDEGLASGLDVPAATASVYEDLKEALAGEEDATVIWRRYNCARARSSRRFVRMR
jgi:hypothetical protein